MDQLILDSQALTNTAQLIRAYCQRQKEILDKYLSNIQSLDCEWQDDETFYGMYSEISALCKRSEDYFDEICSTFPQMFEHIAQWIETRPSYGQNGYLDASLLGFVTQSFISSRSPDVKRWSSGLDQLSGRLCRFYSQNYSSYISADKLNRPLKETVCYETKALFRARNLDEDILGYNDGYKSHISVGTGHELQTTVHENLHQLSSNNGKHGIVVKQGKKLANVQINEAITELLTMRTLGEDYGPDYSAYSDNRDALAWLESYMGEDVINRSYFKNQPELMQRCFDDALGQGMWDELSVAFDDCLSEFPHTRNAGKIRRNDLIFRYSQKVGNKGGVLDWKDILM